MIVVRKRLLFWLIKAYIKKSGKTIIFSFFLGLVIFFVILFASSYLSKIVPVNKHPIVGMVGAYTQDTLPPVILHKLSRGLTLVNKDGSIVPDLAESWNEIDDGKTYIFHIKHDQYFSDGKPVTSEDITFNFSDVQTEKPDKYTIIFKMKELYIPFLATLAKPIFIKGFIGTNDFRVEDIKLNSNFIQSMTLVSKYNRFDRITYKFYPSEDALKMAFLLGEITEAGGLSNPYIKNVSLYQFPNVKTERVTNNSKLVTLFYNTADASLSDRKLRIALSYALPDIFANGKNAFLPYSPDSIFYNPNKELTDREQDFKRSKLLISSANTASGSAGVPDELTIKTFPKYHKTADEIAAAWKQIGIKTVIEETDNIPDSFQILLGDFNIPKDPDQYILWHSGQNKNITHYKNVRIDKLLEEGRQTTDIEKRKAIYADFQKFILDDVPASFLYFPYEYDVMRK